MAKALQSVDDEVTGGFGGFGFGFGASAVNKSLKGQVEEAWGKKYENRKFQVF